MEKESSPQKHHGSCLCGGVQFEISAKLAPIEACHCEDCRKFTGHYFASIEVESDKLNLHGEELISWYQLDDRVRRGFCSVCGSSLFWDPIKEDWTAIAAGSFNTPLPDPIQKHIWVRDKPGYYEINDSVPKHQGYEHETKK